MNSWTIEFVAGLLDADETAEEAALRELAEEVGYKCVNVSFTRGPMALEPGFSNSIGAIVFVEIDGDDPMNQSVHSNPEETESISPIQIPLHEIEQKLLEFEEKGCVVSIAVWSFALGALGRGGCIKMASKNDQKTTQRKEKDRVEEKTFRVIPLLLAGMLIGFHVGYLLGKAQRRP